MKPPVLVLARANQLLAPPRQARSLEKRRRLLAAARALFAAKGYEATSIGDITTRAGTAAGAFYTYFRSKQQLLIVLMNELIARLSEIDVRPAPSANMRLALRKFLTALFRADIENFGVIRAWQEAVLTDPDLAKMNKDIESWTGKRILGVFTSLQQLPNARRGGDLEAFSRMMDRHFWSLLARGANTPPRELQREIDVAADVIYHSLFRDAPRS